MTILERTHEATPHRPVDASTGRRPTSYVVLAIVAVVALALGLGAGWLLRGSGDDDAAMVAIGGAELTDRQVQMIDFIADYEADWHASDGAAVAARFAPNGTFRAFDFVLRADDGLAEYVENNSWASLEVFEPMVVRDNEVLAFHDYAGAGYAELLRFTTTGDLLLTEHFIVTD